VPGDHQIVRADGFSCLHELGSNLAEVCCRLIIKRKHIDASRQTLDIVCQWSTPELTRFEGLAHARKTVLDTRQKICLMCT